MRIKPSVLTTTMMVLLTACQSPPPRSAYEAPNVVLITVDTLRADHLSCYGYPKPTSPFLDRLASEGLRFLNAYSTSSWTAPSMASLFTGLYPRQHGVRHGVVEERNITRQEYLPEDLLTLAEMMKAGGYETFAVLANGHTSRETGFARGFDHFRMLWFKESPEPNDAVRQWLPRIRRANKFFLWIHYFDPHAPYTWRDNWLREQAAHPEACRKWAGIQMRELRTAIAEIRSRPVARQALIDLYDGEIRWCDQHIEELCEMLNALSNAVVIVTSDHGEEFLEHDGIGHGENLFEPSIRVPLLVRFPDKRHAGKTVTTPVSNKDIMATLADLVDRPNAGPVPGTSMLPAVEGKQSEADVYFELDRGFDWKGIRRQDWKLLLRPKKGKDLLFHLAQDPAEQNPRQETDPETAAHLRATLQNWMDTHPVRMPSHGDSGLNARQKEQLRSLGYLR